jgi:hypothetical protein
MGCAVGEIAGVQVTSLAQQTLSTDARILLFRSPGDIERLLRAAVPPFRAAYSIDESLLGMTLIDGVASSRFSARFHQN